VSLPKELRRAKTIMLLPGAKIKEILSPGKRCRAKTINVLLPGNIGDENKGNIIIKIKIIKKILPLKQRL